MSFFSLGFALYGADFEPVYDFLQDYQSFFVQYSPYMVDIRRPDVINLGGPHDSLS